MNERINELFEQAAKEFSDEHKYATFIVPNPLKEKFAELIVRECAHVAVFKDDGIIATAEVAGYMAAGRSTAARVIKKNFGVEEPTGWVCPKCGIDRTKAVCPKGHTAAITGECPMTAEAQ